MKEYKKALESYEQASKLAPHSAKIHLDMAEVFYTLKNYGKSGFHFRKAVELNGEYETVYRYKTWQLYNKANDLRFWEQDVEATRSFQQVLLFDPMHEGARQALIELQDTQVLVTDIEPYIHNHDFNSSQPSSSQLAYDAKYNSQRSLSPSIHTFNCRCAECWEP